MARLETTLTLRRRHYPMMIVSALLLSFPAVVGVSLLFYFTPVPVAVALIAIWVAVVAYLGWSGARCGVRIAGDEVCIRSLWGERCVPMTSITAVEYRMNELWYLVTPYSMAGGSYGLLVRRTPPHGAEAFVRIPSTLGSNRDMELLRQVEQVFAPLGIPVDPPARNRRGRRA